MEFGTRISIYSYVRLWLKILFHAVTSRVFNLTHWGRDEIDAVLIVLNWFVFNFASSKTSSSSFIRALSLFCVSMLELHCSCSCPMVNISSICTASDSFKRFCKSSFSDCISAHFVSLTEPAALKNWVSLSISEFIDSAGCFSETCSGFYMDALVNDTYKYIYSFWKHQQQQKHIYDKILNDFRQIPDSWLPNWSFKPSIYHIKWLKFLIWKLPR